MKGIDRVRLCGRGGLLAIVASAGPVAAQAPSRAPSPPAETPASVQADVNANNGAGGVQDIVVTAQRREQSLQRVPISVVAASGETLIRTGIASAGQLAQVVPGLVMAQAAGAVVTPYLRGIGTQDSSLGSEGAVAVYIDGVYISVPSASGLTSFANVERIEVLKGPQGTLFGRNATGGLLNVITKDPSHRPEFTANIGYASYDTVSGGFYGTTGLSEKIAISLAGFGVNQGKGWGTNLTLGSKVNYNSEYGFRGKVLLEPGDRTKIVLAGDYADRKSDRGTTRHIVNGTKNAVGIAGAGSIYDAQFNEQQDPLFRAGGVSLTVTHDMDWATLRSTSAYRKYHSTTIQDADMGPTFVLRAQNDYRSDTYQQELLLSGTTGRLDFTVGGFYFNAKNDSPGLLFFSPTIPSQNFRRSAVDRIESGSGFGQLTYRIFDATRLTAGIRYTSEETKLSGSQVATAGNTVLVGTVQGALIQARRDNKVTYRFGIDQDLAPGVLLYATHSRGFKSGAGNVVNPLSAITRPEQLDATELGFKSDLFDRLLRLNAAIFQYQYKDIQLVRIVDGSSLLLNAARSRLRGVEVEATLAPRVGTGRLLISGNVSYLDGKYRSFPNAPLNTPRPTGGNIITAFDASGNDMIRTPHWTVNGQVNYDLPVSDDGEIRSNINYYHNSGFFWEPDNRLRQNAYDVVNTQIAYAYKNTYELALFVRNVFKKKYAVFGVETSFYDGIVPGEPRVFGVRLTYTMPH